MDFLGFGRPLPPPGTAFNLKHWSTAGLRTVVMPNTSTPSIRVYDPVRDYWTPSSSGGAAGGNQPLNNGLIAFNSVNQGIEIAPDSSKVVPTRQVTIIGIRRKTDLTARESSICSVQTATVASYCTLLAPWSTGIAYFQTAQSGGGLNSVNATIPVTMNPEAFIAVGGPNGLALYQNGRLLASNATPMERAHDAAARLMLNNGYGASGSRGDFAEYSFLALLDAEWNADQVQEWMAEQDCMFDLVEPISYFFLEAAGPTDVFTIDGTARDILQQWSITEQLNERGTMRFGVKSMDASYRPLIREEVDFHWAGQHFFAGHIHHTEESALGNLGYGVVPIQTLCGATDYNALPDRRQVALTLVAGPLKSMLEDFVIEKLAIYGVSLDPAQVNGPTIADDLVFRTGPLTAILDKLSVITGYGWNISYDKVLSMFAPGTESAPFNIVDNDSRVIGDVRVSPTTVEYGNYIRVKFTIPAEEAFVYFIIDTNPSDDTTFKVAGNDFVFKTTPTDPNHVQIGATINDTYNNFVAAVDPLDEVTAFNQTTRVDVVAAEAGLSGNSIQVESNDGNGGADFHWGVDGVPVASHLYYGTDAALTGLVTAEDVPAQDGGANLYEKTYEEPTVESEETAQALADGYLVRSLVQPREVHYRTRLHGLHPGQQQQIQVTGRNVDGPCLITAVDITPVGPAKYNYDVTAVEGLVIVPSHQDGWRSMAGRELSGN